jgi:hypothetical protein
MEHDPILDALRGLKAAEPGAALDAEVRARAHAMLQGPRQPWPLAVIYRGVVPMLLSGATAVYLLWAVQAASALY